MDREFILDEIRRTAIANGGVPLGRLRLESASGIKETHWRKYWVRYGDAVKAAGFEPNPRTEATSEAHLIHSVIQLARELSKFPTQGELRVKRTNDAEFPSPMTFRKFGSHVDLAQMILDFGESTPGYDDVTAFCRAYTKGARRTVRELPSDESNDGFVYLMRSGKRFKIGKAIHPGSRERQLAIQLPDPIETLHTIRTDDPHGIEAYWHRRFAAKRLNGEWFSLGPKEVAAFRRRKFM